MEEPTNSSSSVKPLPIFIFEVLDGVVPFAHVAFHWKQNSITNSASIVFLKGPACCILGRCAVDLNNKRHSYLHKEQVRLQVAALVLPSGLGL